MEMSAAEWLSALGQTALVTAIAFVVLCIITSLVRFQMMTEAATESEELGLDEEKAFRLVVMNQIAAARKAREPLTVMLLRIPPGGSPREEVEARLKSHLRSTDTVMSCGDELIGVLLLCGSDKAGLVVDRLLEIEAVGNLAGIDRWHFGVAGYPEHGFKTSELYGRALQMLEEAEQKNQRVAGMAATEEVAEEKSAPADLVDPLTGLVREDKMINTMRRYIGQARRVDKEASLIYMQVDQFEQLAGRLKEETTNALIKELAGFIDRQFREQDLLCRFGPAGMVAGLLVGPEEAMAVTQRVAAAVRKKVFAAGQATKLTISAGVAGYPDVQGTAVQYFVAAEIALQQAQGRGRNQVVRYEPTMQARAQTETSVDRL
jgi:diguanylate cyclase (GGDEF)-like protein